MYKRQGQVWYVNATTHAVKTFRLSPPDKLNYVDMERYHIVHDSRAVSYTHLDGYKRQAVFFAIWTYMPTDTITMVSIWK